MQVQPYISWYSLVLVTARSLATPWWAPFRSGNSQPPDHQHSRVGHSQIPSPHTSIASGSEPGQQRAVGRSRHARSHRLPGSHRVTTAGTSGRIGARQITPNTGLHQVTTNHIRTRIITPCYVGSLRNVWGPIGHIGEKNRSHQVAPYVTTGHNMGS